MADFQTIAAALFLVILTIFVFLKRKKLDTKQVINYFVYFSVYRTTLGLKLMNSMAKYKKVVIYILSILGLTSISIISIVPLIEKTIKGLPYAYEISVIVAIIAIILACFSIFIPLDYKMPVVGFLGMIFIGFLLIYNVLILFTKPEAVSGVGLVLPFKAKGVFFVPFFYWIISIFVIAIAHEFSHGIAARTYNLKVKSSGFAFLGSSFKGAGIIIILLSLYIKIKSNGYTFSSSFNFFDYSSPDFWMIIGIVLLVVSLFKNFIIPVIPAAFVEPDEKKLKKMPHKEQLSVFAAGPLANIALGLLFVAIASFVLAPLADAIIEPNGVKITDYVKDKQAYPAEKAGIKIGEVVQKIDGMPTPYMDNLSSVMKTKKPNDIIVLKTDKESYEVKLAKNPQNESTGYLGAYLEQSAEIKENVKNVYGEFLPDALLWTYGLFVILFILNMGIGLFNLAPIGPLDGGRMLQLAMHKIFGTERGNKYWIYVGIFFLALILVNIAAGFVK